MCLRRTQSPRGISGQFLKGPGLISSKLDLIIPTGAMPHGVGAWHITSRIPFGARIDYWIGPKLRPMKDLRFDPTLNPCIFLEYAIQPGFIRRNEYIVASLRDFLEKGFRRTRSSHSCYNQLTVPEGPFIYPLKGPVTTFKYVEGGPDREAQEVVSNTSIFKCSYRMFK